MMAHLIVAHMSQICIALRSFTCRTIDLHRMYNQTFLPLKLTCHSNFVEGFHLLE